MPKFGNHRGLKSLKLKFNRVFTDRNFKSKENGYVSIRAFFSFKIILFNSNILEATIWDMYYVLDTVLNN